MSAVILPFPRGNVDAARLELDIARRRLRRIVELDARDPENWHRYQWARERVAEAETRLREVLCRNR